MTEIFNNSAPATRYDKTSTYLHIMRRNGKMLPPASGRVPGSGRHTIVEAITSDAYRLRWPWARMR